MFGFGLTELLVILAILLLLFGTRKLKNVGSDLGGAIKGFRRAMNEDEKSSDDEGKNGYIEGEARHEEAESTKAKSGVGNESKH